MGRFVKLMFLAGLAILVTGCHGGRRVAPQPETKSADSSRAFVFAETPFLAINADMMAEQFYIDQVPATIKKVDSATALNAVYAMLLDSLLAVDAKSYDLRQDPVLYRQYLMLRYDKVMRLLYQQLIVDSVTAIDSEVTAEYEATRDEFKVPEMFRARHIVQSSQGLKVSADSALYRGKSELELDSIAHGLANKYNQRLLAGAPFDTLAMLYSHDPGSKTGGGDLGFLPATSLATPFDSVVKNLPVGQISGVFKTVFGWHTVRVEEVSPEHYLPLDSARAQVVKKVTERKLMARSRMFLDSIRADGTVELDSAALQKEDSLHARSDPMAFINRRDKKYGNDTLTFQDYAEQVYPYQRSKKIDRSLTFDEKAEVIAAVAMRYHLLRAARKLGFYTRPEVEQFADQIWKRYVVSIHKKELIKDTYVPTEEEIKAYYDSHLTDYQVERPIYVQHIIFADSALAEYVRDVLMSGGDFLKTAQEYYPGDPDIRQAASDLGTIGPNDMPPAFWRAASSTPIGEISRPVKTEFGYHLIKVISRQYSVDYETAKDKIKPILQVAYRERVRKDYVDAKLGGPPKIHWERLGDLYRKVLPPPDFSGLR